MSKGFYGKSFYHDCICNEADVIRKEEMEDRYFSGNPDGAQYENHETVDTSVGCPRLRLYTGGFARRLQEPRPAGPLSVQEAEDYYDAIEWAGTQPWSNGNVGLWGMSYLAMTQHNVASLQPRASQGHDRAGHRCRHLQRGPVRRRHLRRRILELVVEDLRRGTNHCGNRRQTDWMARALPRRSTTRRPMARAAPSSCAPT